MSTRYIVQELEKMREEAGFGILSMGVCRLSGEMVSSTPIPGSRCGGNGQNPSDYGGYLVGEGMTQASVVYLANLHNHFPEIAKAALASSEIEDEEGDSAYLERIRKIAEAHGWDIFEGSLSEWIDKHLEHRVEALP